MAFIRSITIVHRGPSGVRREVIQKERRRRRKVSGWLRPFERTQRRMLKAQKTYVRELSDRHARSNGRRRNGFLRDGLKNQMRASVKALRKLG